MAAVTAAVAVGASAVGGAMQARSQAKAAKRAAKMAEFNPFNISGAGGNVTFGPDGTAQVSADSRTRMFQDLFAGQAQNLLSGNAFGQGVIDFASAAGTDLMPQLFGGALQASDASGLAGGVNAFSDFSAQNALFGQGAGMNALAMASNFGQRQTGINEAQAQAMFGFGQDALANTDFSSLAAEQIARQRAFARPGEERAVNSKFQNLFNRGVLSQTGGERQIGELALSQELADIQRVNAGESFANMLQQQNRQFGLNAFGQGAQFRGMDQSFNLGAANLFANAGQNLLNFGQGAGQTALNAQIGFNELMNTRGQQRLANISQLLGFGQQMQTGNINAALGLFGANRAVNADLRQLIALGGNLGGQKSAAGAAAGNLYMQGAGNSIGGSFLSGLGSGLMSGLSGGFLPGTT